ncbi:thioredoxin-like protein [Mariannaea sp. PMI_226]|nr:thioredoxin-like protein [Mariannaea sp. PMI_226]
MGSQAAADITLYTNHRCPWAHRAHIVLTELGIPFKEEIIDLDVPRTPEYLKINPRGQVPTLIYNGENIRESAIVAQFFADAYPSHLVPSTSDPEGPIVRARIAFFVDAWFSKVQSHFWKIILGKTEQDTEEAATEFVDALVKEIEPLLANAGPFFGGKEKITLAEVQTGPFVLRLFALSKHGVIPTRVTERLQQDAPNFFRWAQEVVKHPSVLSIFNEEAIVEGTKKRQAKIRAAE